MTDQSSKPKRSYSSRRPGTNPRTGEKLVPWEAVQVLDPETPAWDYFLADVPAFDADADHCHPALAAGQRVGHRDDLDDTVVGQALDALAVTNAGGAR